MVFGPAGAGWPLSRSTGTSATVRGAGKGVGGAPARASSMNQVQAGRATRAPLSLSPRVRLGWSCPTQTPAANSVSNPMNQASVKSFVVPVFPAMGRPSRRADTAVPRCTTPSSRWVRT